MRADRVIVITGASGGIGTPVVERFLANGDTVIATGLKDGPLNALRTKLAPDAKLHTIAADVSDPVACGRVADLGRVTCGRVDILVNVAGFFPIKPFDEMTADDFHEVVDINLTGVFLMIKATLPLMKGRGWGRIVNIGSAAVFDGVPDQAHYVAAKAGVVGLSRSLAHAFGPHGITVNVVTPGLTLTPPVIENLPPELLETQIQVRALKREERPEDLVGAVFFLASPDADFITGQVINVDGGKHMH